LLPQAQSLDGRDLVYRFMQSNSAVTNLTTLVAAPGLYNVQLDYTVDGTQGVLQGFEGPINGQPALPFVLTFQNPPATLVFSTPPIDALAKALMSPVSVQLRDAFDDLISSSTAQVTLSLSTNPGGAVLGGTKIVNAVGGVATFNDLTLDRYGIGYTLAASGSGLTSATSNAFNVQAKLAFTTQPTNTVAGSVMGHDIVVQMRDVNGAATGGSPTVLLTENPGGEVAGSTSAVNGVATFSGVTLYVAGPGVTLTASGPGLVDATSVPFSVAAGVPTQLAFTPQPVNAAVNAAMPMFGVRVLDANYNLTSSSAQVTISLGANPVAATLSGTRTTSAIGGVASFSTLMLDKLGTGYTLKASAPGLADATSNAFNVVNDAIFANGFQ
jgi:hypothetical protein